MQEYNEGSITGMGYLTLVNTAVNWLLMAFALSRSFVIGLSFTLRVGMPMFSRLFAKTTPEDRLWRWYRPGEESEEDRSRDGWTVPTEI